MIIESYVRVFVDKTALDSTVAFYCQVLDGKETLRTSLSDLDLQISTISSEKLSILVIAGAPEKRAPFERTKFTVKVDDINAYSARLTDSGAKQLENISTTPVGWKTRFEHPDGILVEYVEHKAKV